MLRDIKMRVNMYKNRSKNNVSNIFRYARLKDRFYMETLSTLLAICEGGSTGDRWLPLKMDQ